MQVSSKLRRSTGAYMHYCQACQEMHPLPDTWQFNGDLEKPTFTPSFRHSGTMALDPDEPMGPRINWVCHYFLTDGVLNYLDDCTHKFRGLHNLPDLPMEYRDDNL